MSSHVTPQGLSRRKLRTTDGALMNLGLVMIAAVRNFVAMVLVLVTVTQLKRKS